MVRSILVGLLIVSGASACGGGGSDAPAVQPGAPVGKVVEVTGKVTATRGTATRDLDAASSVSGDDVITTAAGARVVILLAHNNATWDLGPNKHEQVSQSMAWKLAKVDAPAGQVDETTTAAGRHAERSAANGESAAAERSRDQAPAAAPQAPPPVAAADPAPAAQAVAPPPPPPPPPRAVRSKSAAPRPAASIDELGVGGGGGAGPSTGATRGGAINKQEERARDKESDRASDTESMAVDSGTSVVKAAVDKERAALRSCVVASGKDKLAIVFHVAKGKTSIELADGSDADRACLAKIASRIKLTVDAPTTYSIVIAN